ncbi:MAG TPA: SMC-Scp complex subunit ScpB, partial [Mycobacteriales bacterium]
MTGDGHRGDEMPDTADDVIELELPALLEALLVTLDGPLVPEEVCTALRAEAVEVVAALEALSAEYAGSGRGFALRSSPTGWLLYAVPAARSVLERVVVGERAV